MTIVRRDDEERKEDIRYLVNTALPKDMFELVGDDTMSYIGGVEQWKENFVTNIRKKAEARKLPTHLSRKWERKENMPNSPVILLIIIA